CVVLSVCLRCVTDLASLLDALGHLAPLHGGEVLDLFFQLVVPFGRENDFLHWLLQSPEYANAVPPGTVAGDIVAVSSNGERSPPGYDSLSMCVDLSTPWTIGSVEIPTRLVLAPMAGVSVQAFRRQGRRYGAGLVCSEMVSCAGLSHKNERTLGYLRIGREKHPLAVQIFGSEPRVMAEAARIVEAAGADLVDINFGCPVRKVTKTGAGASLLDAPSRAAAIVEAVAEAVDVPVCVKMRRGVENGSRTALEVGPQLVDAGAASLTLHPRSAQQMYTGTADHTLTADLVELVDVPVVASGDITSRGRAESVLAETGCAAVMVGRIAQGNPWAVGEIAGMVEGTPTREEVVAELLHFMRDTVAEMGEQRATVFLKKFYGWYLGRGRFPKPFANELVRLETIDQVEDRLLVAAPGANEVLARLEADQPAAENVVLDLPVSIYAGG